MALQHLSVHQNEGNRMLLEFEVSGDEQGQIIPNIIERIELPLEERPLIEF